MLKSMTAYGHASYVCELGRFVVEMSSVNRKHLETNTSLPKELLRYDAEIKKWIAHFVARGQVNLKISVSFDNESPISILPNLGLARQILKTWETIAKDAGLKLSQDTLMNLLAKENDLLIYHETPHDEKKIREALHEVIHEGLRNLVAMKEFEGTVLYQDIVARFQKLNETMVKIKIKAPHTVNKFRQKLKDRLNEFLGTNPENDERVLREVCVYAEKVDIAEEITRFESHLQQVEALLLSGAPSGVGKILEFFIQELNREANTIGSKTADIEVSHFVIEIKNELERIREQIQNIE